MNGHYKGHILHSRRYSRRNSREKKVALILSTYLIQLDFFSFHFVNTIAQDSLCFYLGCCNQLCSEPGDFLICARKSDEINMMLFVRSRYLEKMGSQSTGDEVSHLRSPVQREALWSEK